jgi:tetratricopeptide (TPR) repeat protein
MKLFVSAVSSEFGSARSQIASDLRARGITVKVQDDFRQEAGAETTLALLHNYIRDCDAIICIVGRRHGTWPPEAAVRPFLSALPASLTMASYTHWELFFARRYQKRVSLHIAGAGSQPEVAAISDEDPALQTAFTAFIKNHGYNYMPFVTPEQLRINILREDWPDLARPIPISLPYRTLGPLFKGREAVIKQLDSSLRGRDGEWLATAIIGKAIHGLGGVGKTRLAVEYAWHHAADYSAILFVTANTPQALQRNLASLCGPLILNLPEKSIADEETRLAAAVRWMQLNPGWLLILDNVDSDEAADAAEKRLADLRGGHVILTSRLSQWGGGIGTLELDVLALEAATAFLLERTLARRRTTPTDVVHARSLANELGQLSLALEQAGAYISERRLAFEQYLSEWRENRDNAINWFDRRVMHYPRSVAVTWKVSVDLLSPHARRLLDRLAWFAPDPVPEALLATPFPDSSAGPMQEALSDLERYSLITRAPDAASFSVHRLVQDVTRRSLAHDARHQALASALGMFNVFPRGSSDPDTWPTCSAMLPHAISTADHAEALEIEPEKTAQLLSNVGVYLWAHSDLVQARDIHLRALALCESYFGADSLAAAASLNNAGLVLWDLVDLPGAQKAYERALAIRQARLGDNDPSVAASLSNLGAALWDLARLAEARTVLERSVAIMEERLAADHPARAACLSNLGAVLCDLGEPTAALASYQKALKILAASTLRGSALVRSIAAKQAADLGECAVARAILEPTLAHRKRRGFGGRSLPSMRLPVPWGRARGQRTTENPSGARVGFNEPLGTEHPTAVKILDNMGVVLSVLGDFAAAQMIFERVLKIRCRQLGNDHPDVGWSLTNLGVVLGCTGRLAEAKAALEKGLSIRQVRLAKDHPDVATNLSILGTVLGALDELNAARTALERALALRESSLGAHHPTTTRTRENLAVVLRLTAGERD